MESLQRRRRRANDRVLIRRLETESRVRRTPSTTSEYDSSSTSSSDDTGRSPPSPSRSSARAAAPPSAPRANARRSKISPAATHGGPRRTTHDGQTDRRRRRTDDARTTHEKTPHTARERYRSRAHAVRCECVLPRDSDEKRAVRRVPLDTRPCPKSDPRTSDSARRAKELRHEGLGRVGQEVCELRGDHLGALAAVAVLLLQTAQQRLPRDGAGFTRVSIGEKKTHARTRTTVGAHMRVLAVKSVISLTYPTPQSAP